MPHPARPTVTLHDVAAAAGVSVATASRVLGGSSRTVAPEYERKVLAAATALRYTADLSARAMRRKSDAIALVADDLTTPSIGMVVAAMERRARSLDAFVSVSSTGGVPERQLETVRTLCALRPRALVLTSSRFEASALGGRLLTELRAYEGRGGRVVVFGETDMPVDSINIDNQASARLMGAHVASRGPRRVAVLAGPAQRVNVSVRATGFVEGLAGTPAEVIHCAVSREGGYDVATRLVRAGLADIDALICANDVIAIGALAACRAAGVDVPGRLAVTGFDDIPLAVDVTPRLTTIAMPLREIGAETIRMALGGADAPSGFAPGAVLLQPQAGGITRELVRGNLVVRDSTA